MKPEDIAPPYTAVTQHEVFPTPKHDDAARFNFLANFNRYMAASLGAGNKLAYEKRVLPAFVAEHGREPNHRYEIREAMNKDPWHQAWSAVKRNSMEYRQQTGRTLVLRQLPELIAKVEEANRGSNRLALDPSLEIPAYQKAVDIHCMPGNYQGEECENDISSAANYDCGIFATTAGGIGALSDGGGQALAKWIKETRPGWSPRRVLDIGCTVGHNIVPLAQAFPDCEIIAIDVAPPVLRYAHARAKALGVDNIRFVQANAEDLSQWPDEHFDWVQTTMFLHETSATSLPRIINEGYRVLAPGGLMFHLEQPAYTDDMPLYEQFIRDWDAFNNNEPFWSAMHALDINAIMQDAGFAKDSLFEAHVKAVVDREVFPATADDGEKEDHGRAAAWHCFGAWKDDPASPSS